MSFILKKIFNMRDKASEKRGHGDMEKPFLEHLEDLRVTLMKVVSTLLVTSILCFVFKSELMDFITHPVKLAQLDKVGIQDLPEDMEAADWQKSYNIATSASALPPDKRQIYIDAACADNTTLRTDVQAVTIFRAALTIPEDEREAFLKKMAADDDALQKRVLSFLEANPDATLSDLDRKSNLVDMSALQPAEGFTLSIKLAFFGGIILAFPFLVFFILEFVLPGLTQKEKKMLVPSGIVGFALFLGGVAFAYWVVTPKALEFFTEYDAEMGIRTDWRIGYYVSFVLRVTLIFGLCFELPVVVMALVKLGIISFSGMI
jgi:sec-independent protein translocase protein TatC